MSKENGVIYRISGPVVTAVGISPRMYEVCLLYTSPSPRD